MPRSSNRISRFSTSTGSVWAPSGSGNIRLGWGSDAGLGYAPAAGSTGPVGALSWACPPLDGAIARRAGQLRRQIGLERLSLPDAAIAASAELTGCTLLTRNRRDFEPLQARLDIEFYRNE